MGEETSPGVLELKQGKLFSLEKDNTVTTIADTIDLSNGLAWSSNHRKMFFIDSLKVYILSEYL